MISARLRRALIILLALSTVLLSACGCGSQPPTPTRPAGGTVDTERPEIPPEEIARLVRQGDDELVRFESEAELRSYAALIERKLREQQRAQERRSGGEAAPVAAEAQAPADGEEEADEESITNNQEAGVDEGGIVKALGDYLIVLRRGRLFSIRVGDRSLTPISMADAFPPGSQLGTWYDEMLVHDRTIVVVGFSYAQGTGATELGLFDVDDAGVIRHRATYFLRSNDYYSSRNYASRLIGDKLVFYMPYFLFRQRWTRDGLELETSLPALTEWVRNGRGDDWNEVVRATDIYRPVQPTLMPVLHTVVTCDLGAPRFTCDAKGILGPFGRTFYVARDAVYVWVNEGYHYGEPPRQEVAEAPAAVYRLPLTGGDPGVLRAWGAPVDQFSFKQDDEGYLNVLVRAEGSGDWMWAPETRAGDVSMMRVPVSAFGARIGTVQPAAYASLPRPTAGYVFNNRFVGDYVLYGTGSSWWSPEAQRDESVYAYPFRGGEAKRVTLSHGVDRIEQMGRSAVVVGTDGHNLHFSEITLAAAPAMAGHFVQEGASQGELRSHGFFFKPSGEDEGVLGLPVRRAGSPGYSHLFQGSAEILFLRVDDHELTRLGALDSRDDGRVDDRCRMSCVDWYGNARPIFYRGRVFALLGYELVEGRIDGGGIHEIGRTNYIRTLLR